MNTGFDTYIDNAQDPDHRNYSPALAKRLKAERRMALALVTECIKRGFLISVSDGGEWVVKRSTDKEAVMLSLASTDSDTILIRDTDGDKVLGRFWLIYGNDGYDVVSDYSDNEVCNDIWNKTVRPLADKIEGGR